MNTYDTTAGSMGLNNMRVFEKKVYDAANSGQSVLYVVVPRYRTSSSKVPYEFIMGAYGSYRDGSTGFVGVVVPNSYGPNGVNLGDVV